MRPDAIIKTLEDAGFEARYVGGCVRDTLLDRPIHDWDIASQALPEDVLRLFPHCVPTGIRHEWSFFVPKRSKSSPFEASTYYNVPNGENLTKYLIYFSPRSFFILPDRKSVV